MSFATINIRGKKPQEAPRKPITKPAEKTQDTNIFNALLSASWSCNVCGKNHHANKNWQLMSCIDAGFRKNIKETSVSLPKPFNHLNTDIKSYTSRSRSRMREDRLILGRVEFNLFDHIEKFHPWSLMMPPGSFRGVHRDILEGDIPALKRFLASKNYEKEYSGWIKSLPEYNVLVDFINNIGSLLKKGTFDFRQYKWQSGDYHIGLKSDERSGSNYHGFDQILSYFCQADNLPRVDSEYLPEKNDFYLYLCQEKDEASRPSVHDILIRINLVNIYAPLLGKWGSIKEAVDYARNQWLCTGQIDWQ